MPAYYTYYIVTIGSVKSPGREEQGERKVAGRIPFMSLRGAQRRSNLNP